MSSSQLHVHTIVSLPFEENSYVVHQEGRRDCLIFDPGFEPDKIVSAVEQEGLTPAAFVCTHGHSDHIGGNFAMKEHWPDAPLLIGHGDADKLTDPEKNLSAAFGIPITSPPADEVLKEGEEYAAAGLRFRIYEIAGHSSGHIALVLLDHLPAYVFGGDVLFRRSIGRTDFPDGSFAALKEGIQEKLFTLPDDTIVLPGHGPPTTIGEEKAENPFVGLGA